LSTASAERDIAALARGGRTNILGFVLRLGARVPFLFIAGRMYGADELGRFAYALVAVELCGLMGSIGLKRGLAQRLSREDRHEANVVADALLVSLIASSLLALALYLFPLPMFPKGDYDDIDLMLVLAIPPLAQTEVALSALAYRFNVGATVTSRAIVEPWTLSIASAGLWLVIPDGGMELAYVLSIFAAWVAAIIPLCMAYGRPGQWRPHPVRLARMGLDYLPLALADLVEWGTRRLDIAILGLFASPAVVGIYWAAQQVASLPQKLKTSFEPILGPVITRNLREGNRAAIARQLCQVGFWITAAQAGIALALGIPGEGVMGLVGPEFVGGTGALAFLLAAEVVAATAVVSEAALVYVARYRNLALSLAAVALQAGLTVAGIMMVERLGLDPMFRAAAAAGALMLALAIASLAKGWLISRLLGEPVNNWRWPLVIAAAPAVILGTLATRHLPEWAELAFGVPAIMGSYFWVVWRTGFRPEDRILFRNKLKS